MKHKFVNKLRTDGQGRVTFCQFCGCSEEEKARNCQRDGLLTHVCRKGVEVWNLWKALGLI